MKLALGSAIVVLLVAHVSFAVEFPTIAVSSDTGAGTTELLYYDASAGFLGDTTNVSGLFTSIAAGDFDNDGKDEIAAARYVSATPESDVYYYEFGASTLYFDTRNRLVRFNSIAAGEFDGDLEAEVVVATQAGSGVVGDLFETELLLYQPNNSDPYLDSTNDDGRFVSVATGNLDADPEDEIVVVKLHEDGLATEVESEFWIADPEFLVSNGDPRNLLVEDLTPNRFWDLTDAAIGTFEKAGQSANIVVTSDRRTATLPETSRAELFVGDTDAETVSFAFDQVPKRSEGMVGVATANLDGDSLDDMAIILNYDSGGSAYATLEIYHADGVSKTPTTVEFLLKAGSQAVAVDTGDLDADGLDEIVVLYDLLNGTSQIVTYDVDTNFDLSVLSTGSAFTGTGTDVVVAGSVLLGDANDDGVLDNFDISPFVQALTDPIGYAAAYPDVDPDVMLDMNCDGVFDNFDISGFVSALTGP